MSVSLPSNSIYSQITPSSDLESLQFCIESVVEKGRGIEKKVSSCSQNLIRNFGKTLIAGFALASKFPYIQPNLELPFPRGIQITCAATNFLSWLVFECDNGFHIIEELVKNPSLEERSLQKEIAFSQKVGKTAMNIGCIFFAVLSQLPTAFQAMDFNSKNLAAPIAAVVIGAGAIFPTRSLLLSVKKIFDRSDADLTSLGIQQKLLDIIALNKTYFEHMPENERKAFLSDLDKAANSSSDQKIRQKLYLAQLLSKVQSFPQSPSNWSILDCTALLVGSFFALNFEAFNAMYAYSGSMKYLVENKAVAGVFSGLVVISTSYLTGKVIVDLTRSSFNDIARVFSSERKKNLLEQFYGGSIRCFQVITFGTNLFSTGAYFQIVRKFFENDPKWVQQYFLVGACVPIFLFLQSSSSSFLNEQIKYWGFEKGSDEKKQIIHTLSAFDALYKFVENLDPNRIYLFQNILPNDLLPVCGFSNCERVEDLEEFCGVSQDGKGLEMKKVDEDNLLNTESQENPASQGFELSQINWDEFFEEKLFN